MPDSRRRCQELRRGEITPRRCMPRRNHHTPSIHLFACFCGCCGYTSTPSRCSSWPRRAIDTFTLRSSSPSSLCCHCVAGGYTSSCGGRACAGTYACACACGWLPARSSDLELLSESLTEVLLRLQNTWRQRQHVATAAAAAAACRCSVAIVLLFSTCHP